jgi:hypothetical protein
VNDLKSNPISLESKRVGAAETARARVGFLIVGAALEAPAVVAGPDDVATVSEAIEQSMVILALLKTLGHEYRPIMKKILLCPRCHWQLAKRWFFKGISSNIQGIAS